MVSSHDDMQNMVTGPFLSTLYTGVRIVQPFSRKVIIDYSRHNVHPFNWCGICSKNKESPCKQNCCIAEKSYIEKRVLHKLIRHRDKLWLAIAIPLLYKSTPSVLELVKDVTDRLTIQDDECMENEHKKITLFQEFFMQMNDMMVKDKLTGLYNKKYLYNRLPRDISEAISTKKTMSILFVDLDKFKLINDDCGHIEGDQLLTDVARILSGTIRIKEDWACRFGGDEFIICLNNVGEIAACQIAERIRHRIFQLRENVKPGISASIGVYTIDIKNITKNVSIEEIIGLADKQMYIAKNNGGNCVAVTGIVE
ncbi:GGDEF domain-containing protein [Pectinatus sottacetonis]|uniref:GGDEF domain-containing protein n=1 Tax=Pectinatus sottacetonis TaxID=1002795 RepID=UPI0018C5710D|nr:GGDEF domain-containing protein [Pectinatus sottacetonis]